VGARALAFLDDDVRASTSSLAGVPKTGRIIPDMGKRESVGGLAETLFTPVQRRVLGLLYGQSEIVDVRAASEWDAGHIPGAVHRFLGRLEGSGLVVVTRVGNQKYYQANHDSPVFTELRGLVVKTVGIAEPLRDALAPLSARIHAAFVYGSVAKGSDHAGSDVDVMILSDVLTYTDAYEALQQAELTLDRAVNPTVMTTREWRAKRAKAGSFVARVMKEPRIQLIGNDDELARAGEPREDRTAEAGSGRHV